MTLSSRFAGFSAFFLGVALFYAPLAYGCTRPDMLPTLYALLGLALLAGGIHFVLRGFGPVVPRVLLFCIGAVLLQGWWMTAHPVLVDMITANGGTTDVSVENIRRLSFDSMVMTTLMLGAFIMLCDLMGETNLRRFLLLAFAGSGTLICVIGVVLKLTGEPLMRYIWKPVDIYWNDFALYRYHGNAGAFLNLVWPVILVFTRRAWAPGVFVGKRMLWSLATAACAMALFLNASKAALAIGLLVLPWPFATGLKHLSHKTLLTLGVGFAVAMAAGLLASSQLAQEAAFQRMTNVREVSASFNGRWAAYAEFFNAVPTVGWFGVGPGLFQLVFPYQTSPLGNFSEGLREFAHQDYLQTAVEWGWLGTVWWTVLVAGGVYRAWWTYGQRDRFPSRTDRHLVLAAALGVFATLAQSMIDFPLQVASLRLFFLVLLALGWASPRLLAPLPREERIHYRLPIPADVKRLTTSSRAR